MRYAHVPVKQAIISPSALSLMYPEQEIPGYPREQFIDDLLREHETEVRRCLEKGAHKVQIDFTEGRLAIKIDPSGKLLHSFIDLNNLALSRFSAPRIGKRIGVHTCPGRRPRLDPQRGCRLRRVAARLVRAQGGQFLHCTSGRNGPRPRAEDHPRLHEARSADFHRRRRVRSTRALRPRKKFATGSLRRRNTFRSSNWARPTTADSRLSATTLPRAATPPLRKSARGCSAPRSRQK